MRKFAFAVLSACGIGLAALFAAAHADLTQQAAATQRGDGFVSALSASSVGLYSPAGGCIDTVDEYGHHVLVPGLGTRPGHVCSAPSP